MGAFKNQSMAAKDLARVRSHVGQVRRWSSHAVFLGPELRRMRSIQDLLGVDPGINPRPPAGAFGDSISVAFPTIAGFLDGSIYGGDRKAKCGSLLVFTGDTGMIMARLSERNKGLDLWGSGTSLTDALQGIEDALGQSPVPWRRQQQFGGGKVRP